MNIEQYIVAETETYVVVNKPTGMSSVDDKTGGKSLQFLLENKYKRPLHAITRIDKVVSGLCLFALSSEGAAELSKLQSKKEVTKEYLAIVEGEVKKKDDHLTHYLRKQGNKAKVSEEESSNSKKANLSYSRKGKLDNYTILRVKLLTGRFHQIRAQLAAIGHPIKGDVKYGARRKNRDRSIHLHSWKLSIGNKNYLAKTPEDRLWEIVF